MMDAVVELLVLRPSVIGGVRLCRHYVIPSDLVPYWTGSNYTVADGSPREAACNIMRALAVPPAEWLGVL